jgi:hypothetical protein
MTERRSSFGLRWFVLLLVAEVALFGAIYFLRGSGTSTDTGVPPSFSRVQELNLQSLLQAKGYGCPTPPALQYETRGRGVVIVATCRTPNGSRRFQIDIKGRVRPL